MDATQDTTNETRERHVDIIDALREAGVDRDLTMRFFNFVEAQRAAAIAEAARLFYNIDADESPITLLEFSDQFDNMVRRMWGVAAAVGGVLDGNDDSASRGVLQLVNDAAQEMERLAEAFDAEQRLAKEPA